VSFKSRPDTAAFKLFVKGEDAGTWLKPDVEVLQKHATPSPFGRGEETVLDPTYRNGTELQADELAFSLQERSHYNSFVFHIGDELATSMFVGKSVTLKLYKLAIYGEGGHFDWHRDSTHSDAHHGTVLVALNTEWEGGDLMLRHQGVETIVNMHPTTSHSKKSGDELRPVVVAFYTDTEHKVMPVTKGTRLVLQYDVEAIEHAPRHWDRQVTLP
jgi:Rps23 Pro-64 3,4-dihydroxylase Tpa1-like proline 4-hydroxylase